MPSIFELNYPNVSSSLISGFIIPHNLCDAIVANFEEKSKILSKNGPCKRIKNSDLDLDINKELSTELSLCFQRYIQKFEFVKTASEPWFFSQPFYIEKHEPKHFSDDWSCETLGPQKDQLLRNLTCMTYLSEIEDGGGDEFLYQNIYTRCRKGLTLIWPSGWTHMHRPIPTNEVKYIIRGWAVFKHRI